MLLCYTGNGKGKTTAALGAALRAHGQGLLVCVIQFMKNADTGELHALHQFPGIEIFQSGKGFYKIPNDHATETAHKTAATHALALADEKITTHTCDLLILDEINIATHLKLLDPKTVISVLKKAPPTLHVILTGRNAPQAFLDRADLVTEMKELKHPFQKGIQAVKGLDF
ncbi:MAG: cob(I)yrinic acid a,c-diamide adenosyltransferase [Candidatus Gracilibacteria bacterium]